MQSILKPKPSDDPHDIVVIAPDAVRVAPAEDVIESLLRDKVRGPSEPPLHVEPQLRAAPMVEADAEVPPAAVPPVDATFRATVVNDVLIRSRYRSLVRRALRAVSALLLAAIIGGAAMAWHYHAEAAQRIIAEWAPLFAQESSQPSEKTGLAPPPVLAAAEVNAANAAPAQPAAQAPTAAEAAAAEAAAPSTSVETASPAPAAASPDDPHSLEAMAHDLANASQEIEQLKASVEQLKASQQQLVAMVSEKAAAHNLRPKKPAKPPRPVAALTPAHKPAPLPPRSAAVPILPPSAAAQPAAAPYVPRQVEPQSRAAAETLNDPELGSVPRPPMPLR